MPIRNSAKAIVIRDGKLLLTKNAGWRGDDYYILPGGGQNPGETLPQVLDRECREELGARVRVLGLRYVRDYIGKNHAFAERHSDVHQVEYMFVCELLDPLGTFPTHNPDADQTDVVWIALSELKEHQIFPSVLKQVIQADGTLGGDVYLGDVN
ncbi:MAG TPA: NUDIX domain-containing protein [Planctomycetota bacterium]|nr:NUDIX domain-containing protein [Planctomycetota bacterium]